MSERRFSDEAADHFRDECGVFGIFGHPEAAHLTSLGLYALQHRGQESAGIATGDGQRMRLHRGMGRVTDTFRDEIVNGLAGHLAIGHTRYSTAGDSTILLRFPAATLRASSTASASAVAPS